MTALVTKLMRDEVENQNAAGYTEGKASKVDQREKLVPHEIAVGDNDEVLNHS